LGLADQIRDFVPAFATIVAPLNELLKGKSKRSVEKVKWSQAAAVAFKKTKETIAQVTKKAQPDLSLPFILTTDASNSAIGAILSQEKNGKRMIIHTFSKTLDKTQLNYSVTDKELLALVKGIEHFKYYLLGKKFILETDHQALKFLQQVTKPNSRLMRWSPFLQDYDFEVRYIPGELNAADDFSRYKTVSLQCIDEITDHDKKKILNQYHIVSGHESKGTMHFLP
ncbi:pol polyprotein, partial [Pseudoloma neurophilia]